MSGPNFGGRSNWPPHAQRIQVPWGPGAAVVGVAGLVAVALAATLALILITVVTGVPVPDQPLWVVLASTLILQLGMLGLAFGLGPLRYGSLSSLFGHRRLPTLQFLGWGGIALLGSIALSAAYVSIAGAISDDLVPDALPPGVDFQEATWLSFISIVLIAPFAEELFFRGFLFPGFAKRYGFWVGALATGLVFGLVHMELARTAPAILSGIVFAAVYWRTGSVWPSVLAHTAQNAIAFGAAIAQPIS